MEYYKNRICITVEELTRSDDGEAVMTLALYKYYAKRRYFRVMRRGGGLGCCALIEFESLPAGKSQLQAKINVYKRQGYAALISGKLGNVNSRKITKEAGDRIVALKRSRVPVYTNSQIFEEFNRIAAERGWKPLKSEKSLVQFLHRPEIEPRWWDAV